MKILGTIGSARKPSRLGVYRLVSTVFENTGVDYELVHLAGKHVSGCIACLGCVKDNGCKVDDDLKPLRGDHDRRRVSDAMQKKMMAHSA